MKNNTKKVLTIDWDYFFHDSFSYDWGHKETVFFLEMIWVARVTARNMITRKDALTEYVPTVPKDFWKIVTNKPLFFVAESHANITVIPYKNMEITNLDAHHDYGYRAYDRIECGNWAWWLEHKENRLKSYRVFYPEWRKENPEENLPKNVFYGLPEPQEYDMIFLCRSGCWTPPWYDDQFEKLISDSGMKEFRVDDYVKKIRSPNLKEAIKMKAVVDKQLEKLVKHIHSIEERK